MNQSNADPIQKLKLGITTIPVTLQVYTINGSLEIRLSSVFPPYTKWVSAFLCYVDTKFLQKREFNEKELEIISELSQYDHP